MTRAEVEKQQNIISSYFKKTLPKGFNLSMAIEDPNEEANHCKIMLNAGYNKYTGQDALAYQHSFDIHNEDTLEDILLSIQEFVISVLCTETDEVIKSLQLLSVSLMSDKLNTGEHKALNSLRAAIVK